MSFPIAQSSSFSRFKQQEYQVGASCGIGKRVIAQWHYVYLTVIRPSYIGNFPAYTNLLIIRSFFGIADVINHYLRMRAPKKTAAKG